MPLWAFPWLMRGAALLSAVMTVWCAKLSIETTGPESFLNGGLAFINFLSLVADVRLIEKWRRLLAEGPP